MQHRCEQMFSFPLESIFIGNKSNHNLRHPQMTESGDPKEQKIVIVKLDDFIPSNLHGSPILAEAMPVVEPLNDLGGIELPEMPTAGEASDTDNIICTENTKTEEHVKDLGVNIVDPSGLKLWEEESTQFTNKMADGVVVGHKS